MSSINISKDFYEKVEGQSAKLVFGKSLEYKTGASSSVAASAESKLKLGVSNGVEMGLHGHYSFYDLKIDDHYGGASFGIEHASQKSFKDVFAVSVGSHSKTLYLALKIFAASTIVTQVLLAAAAGIYYGTELKGAELDSEGNWIDKKKEEEAMKVAIGLSAAISAATPLLAVITGFILFTQKKSIKDKLTVRSRAALAITKNSKAFIGVQGDSGSSGLVLNQDRFSLMLLPKDKGEFNSEGHEVVGFHSTKSRKSNHAAGIVGDSKSLFLRGQQINLSAIPRNDGRSVEVKTGLLKHDGLYGVSIKARRTGVGAALGRSIVEIDCNDEVAISGGGIDSAGKLSLIDQKASLTAGVSEVTVENNEVTISSDKANQKISITSGGIAIEHGGNSIKLSNAGIDIAGGAMKILNPTVAVPAIEKQMKHRSIIAHRKLKDQKDDLMNEIDLQKDQLKQEIVDIITKVFRDTEAKVDLQVSPAKK